MQTQTVATAPSATKVEDRPDDFSFQDTRALKRTMRGVRSVLATAIRTGHNPWCRLFTRPTEKGVSVVATDGHRLLSVRLDATPHHEQRLYDQPLGIDAVRAIANTKSERIGISIDDHWTVLHLGSPSHPAMRFPHVEALELRAFERVLQTDGIQPRYARGINRPAAYNAMKALPKQTLRDEVCRLAIDQTGIRIWASSTKLLGPDYPPDQEVQANVRGPEPEIVFGILRRNLSSTWRTMTAKKLNITVYGSDMPIRMESADGREITILSAAHLG